MCIFVHKNIVRHKSTILQGKILAMARFTGNSHFFFLVCIQEGLNIHWEDFLWQSSLTWSFPLFFHLFEVLFAVLVELFEPQGLTGREGFLGSVRADWRLPWWRPSGLHNRNRCSLQLVKFDNLMRTQICYISSVFQFYLWILLKTYLWYIIFMKF